VFLTPLGARPLGDGVHFSVEAPAAARLDLCLFAAASESTESVRLRVDLSPNGTGSRHVPRSLLPSWPTVVYGYRVDEGPLLLDPYARALSVSPVRSFVVESAFDWQGDSRPLVPWTETVIYEAHVKGLTARHPDVPSGQRGTYLGLAHPAVIAHLKRLGVTTVELLPIQAHADEPALLRRGLTNYWGYNTIGFFAPDARLAAAADPVGAVNECKAMVRALHQAGLEVILDVVFNHTAEGDLLGPTLAFRAYGNAAYYRLDPARADRYEDFTGCGNTFDTRSPPVRRLIADSLRYWAEQMHVDGFRFDLAPALARDDRGAVTRIEEIFGTLAADPVVGRLKLIAEPWDAAPGGYQLGAFPAAYGEWNGRYRDVVRRFWRGEGGVAELATRLSGSADVFGARRPEASINFVTAHDGFTLADLVAYADKHNHANGEGNRDGESENFSANGGVEGPTDDPAIRAARARQRRNFLATLMLSLGVPMVSGGDEFGRTQQGNNNAYCHDSPLSWTPWTVGDEDDLGDFLGDLTGLRRSIAAFGRGAFLTGRPLEAGGLPDVRWLREDGADMADADWHDADRRVLGLVLDGRIEIWFNGSEQGLERRGTYLFSTDSALRGTGLRPGSGPTNSRVSVAAGAVTVLRIG
jgi:glycogen operon protein